MLKNHIKVALRDFVKFKGFAFINIIGLAVGIGCFAFISLYIHHELSYDSFYRNSRRIYRLVTDMELGGSKQPIAHASYPAARAIQSEFPEVEAIGRFFN
jgi:putative ABC transport system permease protein